MAAPQSFGWDGTTQPPRITFETHAARIKSGSIYFEEPNNTQALSVALMMYPPDESSGVFDSQLGFTFRLRKKIE